MDILGKTGAKELRTHTAVGVELLHDFADYLADRLYGFDIVLRLLIILLKIL